MFGRASSSKPKLFSNFQFIAISICLLACTAEKSPLSVTPGEVQKAVAGINAEPTCAHEDLSFFTRKNLGEVIDLDNEVLPRGLFLASLSELLIEKRPETGEESQGSSEGKARVLIREVVGSGRGAEIRCAENVEKFGAEFGLTMTGLVKFETLNRPTGSGFALRQFFFFQDRSGYGVVVSNPKLTSPIFDLRKLIRGGVAPGQLIRTGDRNYVLRYSRELEGGVRARLIIHLDLI